MKAVLIFIFFTMIFINSFAQDSLARKKFNIGLGYELGVDFTNYATLSNDTISSSLRNGIISIGIPTLNFQFNKNYFTNVNFLWGFGIRNKSMDFGQKDKLKVLKIVINPGYNLLFKNNIRFPIGALYEFNAHLFDVDKISIQVTGYEKMKLNYLSQNIGLSGGFEYQLKKHCVGVNLTYLLTVYQTVVKQSTFPKINTGGFRISLTYRIYGRM